MGRYVRKRNISMDFRNMAIFQLNCNCFGLIDPFGLHSRFGVPFEFWQRPFALLYATFSFTARMYRPLISL